jgi:hypothetical protein
MFNRRRLSLAITLGACLLVVSSASADPLDTFTALSTPSHVKPSTSVSYTVSLTTSPSAPNRAQRAKIGIPPGFTVNPASVKATTTAVAGLCDAATWEADGQLIANGKINLRRPGGNNSTLCPGATLTVVFLASSAAATGTYTWTSELVHDVTGAFTLVGSQPSVVVDGIAPTTAITLKPNNPSNVTSPTFTFTAGETSTFQCRLDGAAFASCSSPKNYTLVNEGSHTFAVVATDLAGNVGNIASYPWTIDTLAPAATITLKPSSPSSTNSPTFAFIASESGSFTCRLDAGGFAPCTSPTSYSNLADGPHTFATRATDSAGNTSPEAGHTWTIETRAPTAALASAPLGLSSSSAATFAFSADEPSSFECALDGRGFEQCSSPATYHGLGDGQHAFSVRAIDAVGNLSPAVSRAWTIDTTAPETRLSSAPKSVTTATSATFAFSASETGSFECTLDGAPFALCTSPKSYAGLRRRDHRFEVRAIDAAGNADATPSLRGWKIEAAARAISSSALLAPRGGARVTKPPLLVWRPVARSGYYNVQVFRGKQKVLSVWPTRTRLQLRPRWTFAGRVRRLTAGTYRWYVWPGYGSPSARRYGRLLGQSTFVVVRSARR